jgi:hypothetical protein
MAAKIGKNEEHLPNIDVIFLTCDNYSALWPSFFRLLHKYGPSNHLNIISTAAQKPFFDNSTNCNGRYVTPLFCSLTASWSERLYLALKKSTSSVVLLIIDDFFLKQQTNTDAFNRAYNLITSDKNIVGITFSRSMQERCKPFNELRGYEIVNRLCPYRINAQISLWKTKYLLSIIKHQENAWDFEVCGSFRSVMRRGIVLQLTKENCPSVFYYDWGSLIHQGGYRANYAEYFAKIEGEDITHLFPEDSGAKDKHYSKTHYLVKCIRSLFIR